MNLSKSEFEDIISTVNLKSQKNGLDLKFNDAGCDNFKKLFKVELIVTNPRTKKSLKYFGYSRQSKKFAKTKCCTAAINDNFIDKIAVPYEKSNKNKNNPFQKTSNQQQENSNQQQENSIRQQENSIQQQENLIQQQENLIQQQKTSQFQKSYNQQNANQLQTKSRIVHNSNQSQFKCFDVRSISDQSSTNSKSSENLITSTTKTNQLNSIKLSNYEISSESTSPINYIYELFLTSKQFNTKLSLEYVEPIDTQNDKEVVVKVQYGRVLSSGVGSNDLEAIQNAAKGINNGAPKLLVAENIDEEIGDSNKLLQKIYVSIGAKDFNKTNLLSVEKVKEPFYLYKCQIEDHLGCKLIAYGFGESREESLDIASSKLLKNMKYQLEDKQKNLIQQRDEINNQLKEVDDVLKQMREANLRMKNKRANQKYEEERLNFSNFDLQCPLKKEKIV